MRGLKSTNKENNKLWKGLQAFWKDEDAMGSVEIILIIVVLVGLVLIFRTQITKLVENAFKQINSDQEGINKDNSISGGILKK